MNSSKWPKILWMPTRRPVNKWLNLKFWICHPLPLNSLVCPIGRAPSNARPKWQFEYLHISLPNACMKACDFCTPSWGYNGMLKLTRNDRNRRSAESVDFFWKIQPPSRICGFSSFSLTRQGELVQIQQRPPWKSRISTQCSFFLRFAAWFLYKRRSLRALSGTSTAPTLWDGAKWAYLRVIMMVLWPNSSYPVNIY